MRGGRVLVLLYIPNKKAVIKNGLGKTLRNLGLFLWIPPILFRSALAFHPINQPFGSCINCLLNLVLITCIFPVCWGGIKANR